MEWTYEKPEIDGYFWFLDKRPGAVPTLEFIERNPANGEMAIRTDDGDGYPWYLELKHCNGQWAGPVLPPNA